jgi:hypothetical protein
MNFLLLLGGPDHHDRWDALSEDERDQAHADFIAFEKALVERGTRLAGDAVGRPETARTIRTDGTVTDGPFAESVEQLGGFILIDVPTIEDATELADLLPKRFATEIRPCLGVKLS